MERIRIAILGSTGSIGTQALDVVRHHPDIFEVTLLTANNSVQKLAEQAREFKPDTVVICNREKYSELNDNLGKSDVKVFAGIESVCDLVRRDNVDIVLAAMVGFSGLRPTLAAIDAGKTIALANKETLVAAGEIVFSRAKASGSAILPVDSEHSAIFQCLQGERSGIEKILLTASGGPFLRSSADEIRNATLAQALKHPRWDMGAKVTIDSASMMNKGFEMIEAHWLFNVKPKDIEIVIHPESVVHSMVQFADGSVKAQLGSPDMRLPIQYALSYPYRLPLDVKRLEFGVLAQLHFEKPDFERFPTLRLAYEAINRGGNAPCAMNAANEAAVRALTEGHLDFYHIPQVIERTLERFTFVCNPDTDAIYATDTEGKAIASEIIKNI